MTDAEWLLQRMPKATENQVEQFVERVCIIVDSPSPDYNTLNRARGVALKCFFTHE